MAIVSKRSKRSKLSTDDMQGTGDMHMKSALERASKVTAVAEVETEIVKGFEAMRAKGALQGRGKRRKKEMMLQERSDGLVRDAGEHDGGMGLGDRRATCTEERVRIRRGKEVVMLSSLEGA